MESGPRWSYPTDILTNGHTLTQGSKLIYRKARVKIKIPPFHKKKIQCNGYTTLVPVHGQKTILEKDISYWKRMRAVVKKMQCYGYTTLVHGKKKISVRDICVGKEGRGMREKASDAFGATTGAELREVRQWQSIFSPTIRGKA
jgi:hypothetical protein